MSQLWRSSLKKCRKRFMDRAEDFPALRIVIAQCLNSEGNPDELLDHAALELNSPDWVSEQQKWVISRVMAGRSKAPVKRWVYRYCGQVGEPLSQEFLESRGWYAPYLDDGTLLDEGVLTFEEIANDAGNSLPVFSDPVLAPLPASFHETKGAQNAKRRRGQFCWIYFLFHLAWLHVEGLPLFADQRASPLVRLLPKIPEPHDLSANCNRDIFYSAIPINLFHASVAAIDWLIPDYQQCPLKIENDTVFVNGSPVSLKMKNADRVKDALTFISAVIGAGGNWISGPEIDRIEKKKPNGNHGIRWDRLYYKLPP